MTQFSRPAATVSGGNRTPRGPTLGRVRSTLSRRGVLAGGALVALAGCRSDEEQPDVDGAPVADWSRLRGSVQGSLVLPSDAGYERVRLTQNPRYDGQRPLAVLSVAS